MHIRFSTKFPACLNLKKVNTVTLNCKKTFDPNMFEKVLDFFSFLSSYSWQLSFYSNKQSNSLANK